MNKNLYRLWNFELTMKLICLYHSFFSINSINCPKLKIAVLLNKILTKTKIRRYRIWYCSYIVVVNNRVKKAI